MRTVTAIILGAAALAAPAQAQEDPADRPQPSCAGLNFTDQRGDVSNPGLDVVSGFLTTGGGAVYANFVVADLDRKVDQPDMTIEWFMAGWSTDTGSGSVSAHLRSDGSVHGGSFFEGEDGVVQMQLPGVSPATPIKLWAYSGADRDPTVVAAGEDTYVGFDLFGQTTEEIEGSVQAASCPTQPAAAETEPDDAGKRTVTTAPAPARVELLATRASGRAVRLTLRSAVATTVRATLSRGGRMVARGSARIDGTGSLVLTARRALRAGTYRLRIPGVATRRVTVR